MVTMTDFDQKVERAAECLGVELSIKPRPAAPVSEEKLLSAMSAMWKAAKSDSWRSQLRAA